MGQSGGERATEGGDGWVHSLTSHKVEVGASMAEGGALPTSDMFKLTFFKANVSGAGSRLDPLGVGRRAMACRITG